MSKSNRRSSATKKSWKNPGARARRSAAMKAAYAADPMIAARRRDTLIKQWKDPKYRARRSRASRRSWRKAKYRRRLIAAITENWKNPEIRFRIIDNQKKALADPLLRARNSSARKKEWANPKVRRRRINGMKPVWKRMRTPAARTAVSERNKAFWADLRDRAANSSPKKIGRGRERGYMAPETPRRMKFAAAWEKLGGKTYGLARKFHPKKAESDQKGAEAATRNFLKRHRGEINSMAATMSISEAENIVSAGLTANP